MPRRLLRGSFWQRHETFVIVVALVAALLAIAGNQAYQSRFAKHAAARSASTCPQLDRLYSSIVKLARDDPRFTLAEIRALDAQRLDRLRRQGCA